MIVMIMMKDAIWLCAYVCVLAWLLVALPTIEAGDDNKDNDNDNDNDSNNNGGFTELVAWMRNHGGHVDDSFDMKLIDGVRGGVAVNDIGEGTELMRCPWELVIGSSSFEQQMPQTSQDMCRVVQKISAELRLEKQSLWYWYLTLHHDSILNTRLPALWGREALDELQRLPPRQDADRHLRWLVEECGVDHTNLTTDPHILEALVLFVTRATAVGMVPIYDLFNHHNGKRNAKLHVAKSGVQLIALEPIAAGDQIFISYGVKSAPTMFNNYGFVESWPQIWAWTDHDNSSHTLAFLEGEAALYPNTEFLKEFWRRSGAESSLQAFQALAVEQNLKLPKDIVSIFMTSARNKLLNFLTTIDEDIIILKERKDNLSLTTTNSATSRTINDDIIVLRDSIAAVEYRINFKQALQTGLDKSTTLLELITSGNDEL